jgi:hypothetical protein
MTTNRSNPIIDKASLTYWQSVLAAGKASLSQNGDLTPQEQAADRNLETLKRLRAGKATLAPVQNTINQ